MAEAAVKAIFDADKGRGKQTIEIKEFVWDQFVKYLSSAILALVLLEISVDFFRGGGVSCFHPADTFSVLHPNLMSPEEVYGFGRDQAAFLNSYCVSSIPVTEYFPLYIIIHGLLLIVPHYIWTAVHKGNFDSFFSIAEKLERLRESETGEYSKENFDRVSKLEKEYGGKRIIFLTYIAKLILQLCVCMASVGFSGGYLTEFSFAFSCPRSLAEDDVIPEGWPLNGTVSCVYVSLRILRLIRVGDFVLTALAGVLIIYGLLWCVVRHTEELGHVQVAKFVFQSYLKAEDFQFQPIIRFGKQKPLRRLETEFEVKSSFKILAWFCALKFSFNIESIFFPGVRNDLEFLVLTLFRSDVSYGRVFKNVQSVVSYYQILQVTAEIQRLSGRDHRLLHLYLVIQKQLKLQPLEVEDIDRYVEKQEQHSATEEDLRTCWSLLCSKLKRNHSRSEVLQPSSEGQATLTISTQRSEDIQQSSKGEATPRVSKWIKARAIFLYSICCCFFRRKNYKQMEHKENISLDESLVEGDYRDNFKSREDPEKSTHDRFAGDLGNIKLLHQGDAAGMRRMVYLLVKLFGRRLSEKGRICNNRALDISFGTFGYFPVLARAFRKEQPDNINMNCQFSVQLFSVHAYWQASKAKKTPLWVFKAKSGVCSVNFHPYYRNTDDVVKEVNFYTNYKLITYPDNIYASQQGNITMANVMLNGFARPSKYLDMILVGPIEKEHHKVSANIMLNTVQRAIGSKCLLLAVRPLRIGRKKCSFYKYEPPKRFFERYDITMKEDILKIMYTTKDEEPCFKIKCGSVSCIFEFQAYHYIGDRSVQGEQETRREPQDFNEAMPSSHHLRNGGDKNAMSRQSIQTDSCPSLSEGDTSRHSYP